MHLKKNSYTVAEATKKLEHYCAYQDRCHKEVTQKLRQLNMIPEAIAHIISHLIQHKFLNEERFAKAFARGKFRFKKWGRQRITRELKFRDISAYNIKTALKEIDNTEYLETLEEIAQKRLDSLKETDIRKRKKKLFDYLAYRGWETHLIYEITNSLVK